MKLPSSASRTPMDSGTAMARLVAGYGLSRLGDGVQAVPRLLLRPLSDSDWQNLFSVARQERILGVLAHAVRDGAIPASVEQASALHRAHVEQLCGDLIRERTLIGIVELLERAGLDHRVLKGPAVARLDYPEPDLRSFADVDLLVRAEEWDDAIAVLGEDGWQRVFPEPRPGFDRRFVKGVALTRHEGETGTELDLHRTLSLGPFGLTVRLADLWDRYEPLPIGGKELYALGAEERFLHACFHAALGDLPPKLVPLRDIAQMSLYGKLDLDRVINLARAWRAEAVLLHAVELAWDTLSLDTSAELMTRSGSLKPRRRELKALSAYLSPRRSYVGLCLAAVPAIRRPSDKARYLAALAFPRRQFVAPRYSSRVARWRSAARVVLAGRGR